MSASSVVSSAVCRVVDGSPVSLVTQHGLTSFSEYVSQNHRVQAGGNVASSVSNVGPGAQTGTNVRRKRA